ncbi:MAG: anti-sigma F factor [Eubacteriales bacterium]|nr:anti-sigma F factor [Eubacteriales bacterium]MDD4422775.1 anti-sigma F factor [Eubacteriales bacterium]HBR32120.1 anti-sigma F factor [Clostridiales bacterium]
MKDNNKAKPINSIKCVFPIKSVNEGLSRMIVAAFISQLDPTVSELADMKTVISEAVTNCIVHAYRDVTDKTSAFIYISGEYYTDGRVIIRIKDKGVGIENIKQAREPLFTTDCENERSGMGFTIMENFTDKLRVYSKKGRGTTVVLEKRIGL